MTEAHAVRCSLSKQTHSLENHKLERSVHVYEAEVANNSPGGDTPYIRMIGMIVIFLGVVIGDLVFFRGCSSKLPLKR